MQNRKPLDPDAWPVGWESHRRNEIVQAALNSTPAERFARLEEMLESLKPRMKELLEAREKDPARRCR